MTERSETSPSSSQSLALGYGFRAREAAGALPREFADSERLVRKVAVIGAGTMGGGIAMTFLNAGMPVSLLELDASALDRGVSTVRANYESQVSRGKLDKGEFERRIALLQPTLRYEDLGDADLAIEAVFENLDVKRQVFERLDAVMRPGAILASNTSTLDLNRIADFTRRPQDVVGMHFFSPAHVMRLLEVVRGEKTAGDVLATVVKLARTVGKVPVIAGVCDGFIGNRMVQQYTRQAGFLLDEGCLPHEVDRAIEGFGFAMGPFRMGDLAGNDVSWAIRKRRYVEMPWLRYSKAPDRLCEMGRFGQKTSAGWYDYAPGQRQAVPSAAVEAMLQAHRAALGIETRRIDADEIVQRLVFALVNEAAHILQEGIAAKASDIDVIYLTGYGFPARHGGPMFYADSLGLDAVVRAIEGFSRDPHSDPQFWRPAPLLARLAGEGGAFNPQA